jgi:hypothetical protein
MNKTIVIILIILLIIICIIITNTKKKENFCETEDDKSNRGYQNILNESTKNEISNMIYDKIMNVLNKGRTLIPGPKGERGVIGPAGSKYEKHGQLVNKTASCKEISDNDGNKTYDCSNPGLVCNKSLIFVKPNIDSSFYWYLTDDKKLKNKSDGRCLAHFPNNIDGKSLGFVDCNTSQNDININWEWNNNNQLVTGASKCLSISEYKEGQQKMDIEECSNITRNGVDPKHVWSFI